MKLIFLGKELDINMEVELIKGDDFGYDAIIIYKNGTVDTRNNCSEIHHLYSSNKPRIAFESDFHHTGGTCDIDEIDVVVIVEAAKMSDNY